MIHAIARRLHIRSAGSTPDQPKRRTLEDWFKILDENLAILD